MSRATCCRQEAQGDVSGFAAPNAALSAPTGSLGFFPGIFIGIRVPPPDPLTGGKVGGYTPPLA